MLGLVRAPSASLFAEAIIPGSPVQATPFDGALAKAGFFDLAPRAAAGTVSIENLFMRARAFRYVHVAGSLRWQSPEETAMRGSGDCKDKSIWLYSEMIKNGYSDVKLVIGRYRDMDRILHAWLIYTDGNGDTVLLDPTKQKRPWKVGEFSPELYKMLYVFDGNARYRID